MSPQFARNWHKTKQKKEGRALLVVDCGRLSKAVEDDGACDNGRYFLCLTDIDM